MNKHILCTVILTLSLPLSACSSDTRTQPVSTSAPPETAATNTKPTEQPSPQTPTPPDAKPEIIFDVHSIAGKNLHYVEQKLGESEDYDEGHWRNLNNERFEVVTCYFQNEKHSVMFHKGKSVRIRIGLPDKKYRFPDDAEKAMRAVGLTGIYDLHTSGIHVIATKVNDFYSAEAVRNPNLNEEPYIQFVRVVVDERFN
ncbi:hypothetical protein [Aneurinibacillus aneurinilyticus]|uniref:Lipoprotein n=1 Tax=Aneurinibacillus aneurinilyticus TaxID=1391 RepID=A0A848D220_ANEAE|nr:hypothetical protein [Aneurinibacillus aneurinilyticus]NMF00063.1 hypothetical protein [Aneurinibacillus aneurinilyticus]